MDLGLVSENSRGVDRLPAVTIHPFGRSGIVYPDHPGPEDYQSAGKAPDCAPKMVRGGHAETVVLDRISMPLHNRPQGLALCWPYRLKGPRQPT
jgi:hypothetical protein